MTISIPMHRQSLAAAIKKQRPKKNSRDKFRNDPNAAAIHVAPGGTMSHDIFAIFAHHFAQVCQATAYHCHLPGEVQRIAASEAFGHGQFSAGTYGTQISQTQVASEKRKEEEKRCLQHKNQRLPGDLKRMMEFAREIYLSKQEGKLFRRLSHRRFCIIRE